MSEIEAREKELNDRLILATSRYNNPWMTSPVVTSHFLGENRLKNVLWCPIRVYLLIVKNAN